MDLTQHSLIRVSADAGQGDAPPRRGGSGTARAAVLSRKPPGYSIRPVRKALRLKSYDYSQAGYYFVTMVTRDRALLFQDEEMRTVIEQCWSWLAKRYEFVELDQYVVMPNHLHGIIVIRDGMAGGSRTAPTRDAVRKPLGRLVGAFKTLSTNRLNELCLTPGRTIWQRDFYERVIRHERELDAVRRYVVDNPLKWELDPDNPAHVGSR